MAGKKNSSAAPSKTSGKRGASKPTTTTNSSSSRTPPNRKPDSQQTGIQASKGCSESGFESEGEELKRQQILLNIFSTTFREVLGAADFSAQLQGVKAALFNRDFEGAFAREEALDVYAARWSPTRALCYGQVLRGLDSRLSSSLTGAESACGGSSHHDAGDNESRATSETRGGASTHSDDSGDTVVKDEAGNADGGDASPNEPPALRDEGDDAREEENPQGVLKILAIGGAAAEIVAFADYTSSHNTASTSISARRADITLLDVGPWGSVVSRLHTALTTTPPISRYASAAARASNKPLLLPHYFTSRFLQKDILSLDDEDLSALVGGQDEQSPVLITLLFTLNELYTTSGIKRTTSFLLLLSSLARAGTLLLVIDSPGSYSEAAVGKEAKRYPMQWLLDHTLLSPPSPSNPRKQKAKADEAEINVKEQEQEQKEQRGVGKELEPEPKWEKIESKDSVWFRVAEGLRYPIPLENMRYQMHLYRACGS
ncbi:hypothetical protein F5Y08DRAFT_313055 [Xylaria arbuscula]|nr:hypothetical protein F5Y08DRAFT_313055 [Xylaria arbuscula]